MVLNKWFWVLNLHLSTYMGFVLRGWAYSIPIPGQYNFWGSHLDSEHLWSCKYKNSTTAFALPENPLEKKPACRQGRTQKSLVHPLPGLDVVASPCYHRSAANIMKDSTHLHTFCLNCSHRGEDHQKHEHPDSETDFLYNFFLTQSTPTCV